MLVTEVATNSQPKTEVFSLSLVVPCFNEEASLDALVERLKIVRSVFQDRLDLEVILVDDGSVDRTYEGLIQRLSHQPWAVIKRHSVNRGISAAILTGAKAARHDWVASMDADCTYDPIQLFDMVNTLQPDTAMVTASPYHPKGRVEGVPAWRLALSKTASIAYSLLIGGSLHTYTSCFRLFKKSSVAHLQLHDEGFVGIAEMLWMVRKGGGKVLECPVVLTSRRTGFSKMRTIPVIFSHISLMMRILFSAFTRTF